ncbi:MAG: succinate dehydrogenase cytochrome b subunit [Desulfotalea sp.]
MWCIKFARSSIGKKIIMACTGLFLFFFLFVHAAGNSIVFFGSHAFQTYADTLHAIPLVPFLFGLVLFPALLLHMGFGIFLYFENKEEGDDRYAVNVRTVKNSFANRTMPWTGLIILFFLIIHLSGFSFTDTKLPTSVLVQEKLSSFLYGLFYLIAFAALFIHLSHGFWSMLQSLGFNHPRYTGLIEKLTYIIPGIFVAIFSLVALYFMTGIGSSY